VPSVVRSLHLRSLQGPKNRFRTTAGRRLARALLLLRVLAGCAELTGDPATAGNAAERRLHECEANANRELDPYVRDTRDRQCKINELERAQANHH